MTSDDDLSPQLHHAIRQALEPLASDQQRLIDAVGDEYFKLGRKWPIYQYAEALFDAERMDARSVIASFPTVGERGVRYGAIDSVARSGDLRPEQPVALTLLGLHQYTGAFRSHAETLIRDVFRVLAIFVDARRTFRPSSTEVTASELTSEQVLVVIADHRADPPSAGELYRLMGHEPPFASGGRGATDADATNWHWEVGRGIFAYDGVDNVSDYLERIAIANAAPPVISDPVLVSPRSLPAALDYLNTVWRLLHGRDVHLIRLVGAERTMTLGYSAGTREEYLERIGALGDLLKNFAIPSGGNQQGGHALARLDAYLQWRLPSDSYRRAAEAVEMLDRVRIVRNAGSHAEAEPDAWAAYRAMGIAYPVVDWGGAWDAVRMHATEAFDSLREEVTMLAELEEGGGEVHNASRQQCPTG